MMIGPSNCKLSAAALSLSSGILFLEHEGSCPFVFGLTLRRERIVPSTRFVHDGAVSHVHEACSVRPQIVSRGGGSWWSDSIRLLSDHWFGVDHHNTKPEIQNAEEVSPVYPVDTDTSSRVANDGTLIQEAFRVVDNAKVVDAKAAPVTKSTGEEIIKTLPNLFRDFTFDKLLQKTKLDDDDDRSLFSYADRDLIENYKTNVLFTDKGHGVASGFLAHCVRPRFLSLDQVQDFARFEFGDPDGTHRDMIQLEKSILKHTKPIAHPRLLEKARSFMLINEVQAIMQESAKNREEVDFAMKEVDFVAMKNMFQAFHNTETYFDAEWNVNDWKLSSWITTLDGIKKRLKRSNVYDLRTRLDGVRSICANWIVEAAKTNPTDYWHQESQVKRWNKHSSKWIDLTHRNKLNAELTSPLPKAKPPTDKSYTLDQVRRAPNGLVLDPTSEIRAAMLVVGTYLAVSKQEPAASQRAALAAKNVADKMSVSYHNQPVTESGLNDKSFFLDSFTAGAAIKSASTFVGQASKNATKLTDFRQHLGSIESLHVNDLVKIKDAVADLSSGVNFPNGEVVQAMDVVVVMTAAAAILSSADDSNLTVVIDSTSTTAKGRTSISSIIKTGEFIAGDNSGLCFETDGTITQGQDDQGRPLVGYVIIGGWISDRPLNMVDLARFAHEPLKMADLARFFSEDCSEVTFTYRQPITKPTQDVSTETTITFNLPNFDAIAQIGKTEDDLKGVQAKSAWEDVECVKMPDLDKKHQWILQNKYNEYGKTQFGKATCKKDVEKEFEYYMEMHQRSASVNLKRKKQRQAQEPPVAEFNLNESLKPNFEHIIANNLLQNGHN